MTGSRSKGMVVSKKWKALHRLKVPDIRSNSFLRDGRNLLSADPARVVKLKGGRPKFKIPWDPFTQTLSDNKKYVAPKKAAPPLPEVENPLQWHKMLGKFQFNIQGSFSNSGDLFKHSFSRVCKSMHLVGWVRCRSNFVVGHVQGDAISLTYLKKWLNDHMAPGSKIDRIQFFDENYGLRELDYKFLTHWNYIQGFGQQRITAKARQKKAVVKRVVEQARFDREENEKYFEEHAVRNY